jgi:hypothetical protein
MLRIDRLLARDTAAPDMMCSPWTGTRLWEVLVHEIAMAVIWHSRRTQTDTPSLAACSVVQSSAGNGSRKSHNNST